MKFLFKVLAIVLIIVLANCRRSKSKSSNPEQIEAAAEADIKDKLQVHFYIKNGKWEENETADQQYLWTSNGFHFIVKQSLKGLTKISLKSELLVNKCGKGSTSSICSENAYFDPKNNINEEFKKAAAIFINKESVKNEKDNCFYGLYQFDNKDYNFVVCSAEPKKLLEFFPATSYSANAESPSFNLEEDKEFDVLITDGLDTIIQKKIAFKLDGVYLDGSFSFSYGAINRNGPERCFVETRLMIMPPAFTNKNIINPECAMKFYYNKIPTYLGSIDPKCNDLIQYAYARIKQGCEKYVDGPNSAWKKLLGENKVPTKWSGYVNYHEISESSSAVSTELKILSFSEGNITLTQEKDDKSKIQISFKDLKWDCDNEGGCSIDQLKAYYLKSNETPKKNQLDSISKDIVGTWKYQDDKHCVVIVDTKTHVICPTDFSEEFNLRIMLSKMVEEAFEKITFEEVKLLTKFHIIYTDDTSKGIKEDVVIAEQDGLKKEDKSVVLDYKRIREHQGKSCSVEVGSYKFKPQFHEMKPSCCLTLMTEEVFYICVYHFPKCHKKAVELAKIIEESCKVIQKEDKENLKPAIEDSKEIVTELKNPEEIKIWKGDVVYSEINIYKFKTSSKAHTGTFDIGQASLEFTTATDASAENANHKFNYETSNFICGHGALCTLAEFKAAQLGYLTADEPKWFASQFSIFEAEAKSVFEKNGVVSNPFSKDDLKSQLQPKQGVLDLKDDCGIYISTDVETQASVVIAFCSMNKEKSIQMKSALVNAYNEKMKTVLSTSSEFEKVPPAYIGREFSAKVLIHIKGTELSEKNAVIQVTKLSLTSLGLSNPVSEEHIFIYSELVAEASESFKYGLELDLSSMPEVLNSHKLKKECCFKAFDHVSREFYICFFTKECIYQKLTSTKLIMNSMEKSKSMKELNFKDETSRKNNKFYDPFDFGLSHKTVEKPSASSSEDIKPNNLNVFTEDNSSNGKWKGYGFHYDLTRRKSQLSPKSYDFIIIDRDISVSISHTSPAYFKEKIENFEPVYMDKPVNPSEYLSFYRNVYKENDYAWQTLLEESVNSISRNGVSLASCIIMDFTDPRFITGSSHMFCSFDVNQVSHMTEAIRNSYYQSLLNINIENGVRKIFYHTDQFKGALIENGNLNSDYISYYLGKSGLFGILEKPNGSPAGPDAKDKSKSHAEILKFTDIQPDNYGTQCAFWYKDLKISEKYPNLKQSIIDDNCCMRFFAGQKKIKTEICLQTDTSERVCVKRMKELMKGLKTGCMDSQNSKSGSNYEELVNDVYTTNTIDDSKNGFFTGFAYVSPATNPNIELPGNPFFVKISISDFAVFTSVEESTPKHSVEINTLKFKCPSYSPCSAKEYLTRIKSLKPPLNQTENLNSVFYNFNQKYTIEGDFNETCFVIEKITNESFLICPFKSEYSLSMKLALVRAYELSHSSVTLSAIHNPLETREWKVSIITNSSTLLKKDVIFSRDGIIEKTNKTVLVNAADINSDPILQTKCALWIKDVKVNNQADINGKCCFTVSINKNPVTICLHYPGVCIGETYKLAKMLYNVCMTGDVSFEGQSSFKKGKKTGVVILPRTNTIFDEVKIGPEFYKDYVLDIAFSPKYAIYEGWVNFYPTNLRSTDFKNSKILYIKVKPERIQLYESKDSKVEIIGIAPGELSRICNTNLQDNPFTKHPSISKMTDAIQKMKESNAMCQPFEFVAAYTSSFGGNSNAKSAVENKINMFELEKDTGCMLLSSRSFNEYNYNMICPHIYSTSSTIKFLEDDLINLKDYKERRTFLSEFYGGILSRIVYSAYARNSKSTMVNNLPTKIQTISKITFHQQGELNNKDEIMEKVKIDKDGLSNDKLILRFSELSDCSVSFNLVYCPKDSFNTTHNLCCLRYRTKEVHKYLSIHTDTCEYDTLMLAHTITSNCNEIKKAETKQAQSAQPVNEVNFGSKLNYGELISGLKASLEKAEIVGSENANINPKPETSLMATKVKSTIFLHFGSAIDSIIKVLSDLPTKTDSKDDPADKEKMLAQTDISKFESLWNGESKEYNYSVGKGHNIRVVSKQNKEMITVSDSVKIIKSEKYKLLHDPKTNYILLKTKLEESQAETIFEIEFPKIKIIKDLKDVDTKIQPLLSLGEFN